MRLSARVFSARPLESCFTFRSSNVNNRSQYDFSACVTRSITWRSNCTSEIFKLFRAVLSWLELMVRPRSRSKCWDTEYFTLPDHAGLKVLNALLEDERFIAKSMPKVVPVW